MTETDKNHDGWVVFGFIAVIVLIVGGLIFWGYQSTKPLGERENNTSSCDNPQIKGNISKSGEKIYHNPDDEYYSRTQIDESAGERIFCTEQEAKDAGWRHSKV
ncbi:hypothetical protein H0W80_04270 [Candidatus Saccharibacteria bacterium]|nr:hypothetical protein [Candidatus Saccharibacteria bacterium]